MASEIKLYNQDCMDAMKQMPDKAFDIKPLFVYTMSIRKDGVYGD